MLKSKFVTALLFSTTISSFAGIPVRYLPKEPVIDGIRDNFLKVDKLMPFGDKMLTGNDTSGTSEMPHLIPGGYRIVYSSGSLTIGTDLLTVMPDFNPDGIKRALSTTSLVSPGSRNTITFYTESIERSLAGLIFELAEELCSVSC